MSVKSGITTVCILFLFVFCFTGCSSKEETEMPSPEKLADYLYYLEMDDYRFDALPEDGSQLFTMGCTGIRKGNMFGRNLDLGYCEIPEFVVRLSAAEGRFASIGLCANPTITCNVAEMTEAELLSMPDVTNDGINENGVIVSENVVDATGVDSMSGTAPGKEQIHSSRIVRYLLDRAESAEQAVELMKDVDIVGGFSGSALHWLIADEQDTYVVEIINNEIIAQKNEAYYMTNFYLNYGPVQPKQYIAETLFENVPLLNEYPIGVERWCLLRDKYESISSEEDMVNLLAAVKATAMYDKTKSPAWYSECIGGDLSVHSTKADFERELKRQIALYENRDRSNPQGDWITWHTSVYDIENRTLCVYSQEDYAADYRFALNE